ncbi:MAG: type II toxin-antitoxin system RelE/ParE family toxin [Ginsengibacter sp.]
MAKRKVTWTKQATLQFNKCIEYIRQESDQNADKVKEKILDKINELSDDRLVHRKDLYKKNNDGHYLYFEILKYRIVYYAEPKEVFIIRIRHTSMEPNQY